MEPVAKKLALLIGVSEYGEGFKPLSASPKDVAALQRVLENPELGGFDQVKTLLNPNPTNMRMEIETLFTGSTREDLILLFFSGHGITDDSFRLYLTTCLSSKASFRSTSVDARFIQDLSDGTYAKRQVIILDCCYSGAFAEGWQRKGDIKLELERELGKEGRVVLTSSSSTQVSFQQEDAELSLYTQYLVEGIETGAADTDRDGAVKVRELHDYAKRKVREVKPKMQPDIIVADDEGYDILLSRVKRDAASQFRQWVEECVDHEQGDILDFDRETLQVRAQRIGLPLAQANSIIESVLEPFRRRQKNLSRYRDKYAELVERQYPLSDRVLERLQIWQQEVLGLEDRDVEPIQQAINRIRAEAIAKAQKLLDEQLKVTETKPEPIQPTQPKTPEPRIAKAPPRNPPPSTPITNGTASRTNETTFSFTTAKITGIRKTGGILGIGGQVVCDIKRENRTTKGFIETLNNDIPLEMVQIPGGTFTMGSTEYDSEKPPHLVTVKPFFMGKFPVTQAQYEVVTGKNPATEYDRDRFVAPDKPLVGVSWHDAVAFCDRLSQQTGRTYRLPSEAEWEYACRAGTETPFYFGETITTDLVNYDGNYTYDDAPEGEYREQTTLVGGFPANAFGLFDMHGNVWEWCLDHWHDNYQGAPTDGSAWNLGGNSDRRIIRGGSLNSPPIICRSANRLTIDPGDLNEDVGFRMVCISV